MLRILYVEQPVSQTVVASWVASQYNRYEEQIVFLAFIFRVDEVFFEKNKIGEHCSFQ